MAAPTPTARVTPAGKLLPDGYQSLTTFSLDTNIDIWEVEMTPIGLDLGEPINITSQHNVAWRTMFLRQLITATPQTIRGFYDPELYSQILAMRGINQTITQDYYDGTTVCYYGGVTRVEFGPLVEGTVPEVTITITPTNRDSTGAEYGPVVTSVTGT